MNLEHANAALFAALALAQGEIENATKNSVNPQFSKNGKASFADLAEILNTVRPVFAKHGMAVVQSTSAEPGVVFVTTAIVHKDGGYITSTASCVPAKADAPGIGAATTYLRRYSLAAMASISQADDDGNAASQRPAKASTEPQKPSPTQALTEAATVAQGGTEALKAWFGGLTKSEREAIAASAEWTSIKAAAGKVQP